MDTRCFLCVLLARAKRDDVNEHVNLALAPFPSLVLRLGRQLLESAVEKVCVFHDPKEKLKGTDSSLFSLC